ncbi:MAG: M15 family metallopeptidase, partial [Clostridia bacterium]|nr:M15 family metallopeptidase [Clostridia bacterium]
QNNMSNKIRFTTEDENQPLSKEELYDIYSSFGSDQMQQTAQQPSGLHTQQHFNQHATEQTGYRRATGFTTDQQQKTVVTPVQVRRLDGEEKADDNTVDFENENQPKLRFDSQRSANDQINPAKKIVFVNKERNTAKIYALSAAAVCVAVVVIAVLASTHNLQSIKGGGKFIDAEVSSQMNDEEYIENLFKDREEGMGKKTTTTTTTAPTTTTTKKAETAADFAAQMKSVEEPTDFTVVNKDNPLTSKYSPNVSSIKIPHATSGCRLTASANSALTLMYKAMKADGVAGDFRVYSAYRSYSYQKTSYKAFQKKIRKDMGVRNTEVASAAAAQIFGQAGTSEHQLGTCVDFCIGEELSQDFLSTDQGKWLIDNSYKFGYILRYPADKATIHHRVCEPWHFRYVGVTAATYMKNHNICLEEYNDLKLEGVI